MDKQYRLLMADPPWAYKDQGTRLSPAYEGKQRKSGKRYETMSLISAQMKLENSYQNLNLNTPYKASDSYSDAPADPKQVLDYKCIVALENLQFECEAYIDGDRAQGRLFDNETLKQVAATTLN
ncbi:MAG: hypothetical protein WC364_04810 [Eubacteriales bacterium]|jgi:hypothetical protein